MWLRIVVFVLFSFFQYDAASEQFIHMETSSTLSLLLTNYQGTAYRLMRAPAPMVEESSLISFLRLRGQFWRFMSVFFCIVISLTLPFHWQIRHHTRAVAIVAVLLCTAAVIPGIWSQGCLLVVRLFLWATRAYICNLISIRICSLYFTRADVTYLVYQNYFVV